MRWNPNKRTERSQTHLTEVVHLKEPEATVGTDSKYLGVSGRRKIHALNEQL